MASNTSWSVEAPMSTVTEPPGATIVLSSWNFVLLIGMTIGLAIFSSSRDAKEHQ